MNDENTAVMHSCAALSLQGTITFPEVVRRLQEIGVERYHADLCRHENTFYMPDGGSHVESMRHQSGPIGQTFSAEAVEGAIRKIQGGQIAYMEFLREIMSAGCVGYFVQIAGRRALYFGRNGEVHLEPFPSPA